MNKSKTWISDALTFWYHQSRMFILGVILWLSIAIHFLAFLSTGLSYSYSSPVISQNDFHRSPEVEVLCNIYITCRWREFFQISKSERENDAFVCSALLFKLQIKNNLSNRLLQFTSHRCDYWFLVYGTIQTMAGLDRNPLSQLFSCEGHVTFISQVKEEKNILSKKTPLSQVRSISI